MKKIKLTPKQNQVINCLQNGWEFVCDSEFSGAIVANGDMQFEIGKRLFWNLYDKGLTYQTSTCKHDVQFDWLLTEKGKNIKTKDIQQDIINQFNSLN